MPDAMCFSVNVLLDTHWLSGGRRMGRFAWPEFCRCEVIVRGGFVLYSERSVLCSRGDSGRGGKMKKHCCSCWQ